MSDLQRLCQVSAAHFALAENGWEAGWKTLCKAAADMDFDAILVPALWSPAGASVPGIASDADVANPAWFGDASMQSVLSKMARCCAASQLALVMDLRIDTVGAAGAMAQSHPEWYESPRTAVLDPRWPLRAACLRVRLADGQVPQGWLQQWIARLSQWKQAGVAGFRCTGLAGVPAQDWRELVSQLHTADGPDNRQQPLFLAWAPGIAREQMEEMACVGFDGVFSSLPWWDGRSSWLIEEYRSLTQVAPVAVSLTDLDDQRQPGSLQQRSSEAAMRDLQLASFLASRVVVPLDLARHVGEHAMRALNQTPPQRIDDAAQFSLLSGALASVTALMRYDASTATGQILLFNPDDHIEATTDLHGIRQRLPGRSRLALPAGHDLPQFLPPAGAVTLPVEAMPPGPVPRNVSPAGDAVQLALCSLRIAIENIQPAVDAGRFPIKRTCGQPVHVQADIFMDGHDLLDAELLWRAAGDTSWHRVPMQKMENDRWQAVFYCGQPGRYCYTVCAWRDAVRTHQEAMRKKQEAGQDISLDLAEAKRLGPAGERSFETHAETVFPLHVERREAQFASWYELFPRSQASTPDAHGTFRDVERQLPAIRNMGFDVLYFPPIHPIGQRNRKGRNNALQAGPDDPGSPYAIGSSEGGHTAVHPELGTLDDFRHLLQAARAHDLEIALDFAIQCSPDHPWLAQHPEWFDWRADGSLRYAENPPKRYEDIVNPDFYAAGSTPDQRAALWRALRDAVLFWADEGVRTFRVDNPHTKPLPFWEWMLNEVQQRYPDTVFLSEAFTRPKMMYRLAKAGFSQSYTYFTWRNGKQELSDYLDELNTPPVADFFRPNFFVNTPDINPYFLQQSGRAGFLIRAALATTLSGLWGMYNGFEVCEAQALPGKEEYADSEKYQLRHWDRHRPGNIVPEITRLNQIRRQNPALQSHLGLRFHQSDNDQILFFSKSALGGDSVVVAAISLDPHAAQAGTLHFPFWLLGLPDDAALPLRQLYDDYAFTLQGPQLYLELTPNRPFALWRLELGATKQ